MENVIISVNINATKQTVNDNGKNKKSILKQTQLIPL
jgi:hypothetical protein